MIINHNIASLNAWNSIEKNDAAMAKSTAKLSSGQRINSASDDAAGLTISEKFRAQIKGMEMCKKNAMDGISLLQSAESSLNTISEMLVRMKELAVEGANGIYNSTDKTTIKSEMDQLIAEIDNVAGNFSFNGLKFLDGTYAVAGIDFQIGVNAGDVLSAKIGDSRASALGAGTANVNVTDLSLVDIVTYGSESIAAIDQAIIDVTSRRADIGAYQNRLEHTSDNLSSATENLTAAEARIRDTDMAAEMANYSKLNILTQAGMSILAQANQKNQSVLKLLQQ